MRKILYLLFFFLIGCSKGGTPASFEALSDDDATTPIEESSPKADVPLRPEVPEPSPTSTELPEPSPTSTKAPEGSPTSTEDLSLVCRGTEADYLSVNHRCYAGSQEPQHPFNCFWLGSQSGDVRAVKFGLNRGGFDINMKSSGKKMTALMMASIRPEKRGRSNLVTACWVEVARMLLAAGADVNLKDRSGGTALLYASMSGRLELVKMLLAAGANVVNIRDNLGRTLLSDVCLDVESGQCPDKDEIKRVLRKAGATE